MVCYLFITGWTIYRDFRYQLSGRDVLRGAINIKYCDDVEVFQFWDLYDPAAMISNI